MTAAAIEVRVCANPNCGKPLVRRPDEKSGNWKNRCSCGRACAITARSARIRSSADSVFDAKVQRGGPGECWLWTGRLDKGGYGRTSVPGGRSSDQAHRYVYRRNVGPIPAGYQIDHTCHNYSGCAGGLCDHRRCVNPAHLEAVPQAVNLLRSHLHHGNKTHCPAGHPYNEANTHVNRGRRHCKACTGAGNGPRPLRPCGTSAAYARHLQRKEPPCAACKAANAARAVPYRAARRQAVAS